MADLNSLIPSLLSPIVPYGQGLHNAGAGMSDLADAIDKKRQGDENEAYRQKELAQQGDIAAATNRLGMRNADLTGAYQKQQLQLRQDALDEKTKKEHDQRVNVLMDMLTKARQTGDRSTIASVHQELQRMGFSVRELDGASAPHGLAPGGLPEAPPAPPEKMNAPITLGDSTDAASSAAMVPEAKEAPGAEAITALTPGGLPEAPPPPRQHSAAYSKLSPAAQAAVDETLKDPSLAHVTEDQFLGMMNHESGMDPKSRPGTGVSGLWQLQDSQAPGLLGVQHLSDLSDADQIRAYPKYLAGKRPVQNADDLRLAQIAPGHIGERDPNAILYDAATVAKWSPETRAANAPMIGPDGAVHLGSMLKGYGLNAGGPASPLAPGGLPDAPARHGGKFEIRDDKGNLVNIYDQNAEDDRTAQAVRATLEPLMAGDPSNPKQRAAAEQAIQYGTKAVGVLGMEKALAAATALYEKTMGRKEPPPGGIDSLELRRLTNNDSQVEKVIGTVADRSNIKDVDKIESDVSSGLDLLKGARSGLTDKVALGTLVRSLSGKAASNDEYTRLLNGDGLVERVLGALNSVVDGGRLPEQTASDLETVFARSQKIANQRRTAAGQQAEALANSTLSAATREERSRAASAARRFFTKEAEPSGQAPPTAPSAPAAPRTTVDSASTGAQDAAKKALARARALLGLPPEEAP